MSSRCHRLAAAATLSAAALQCCGCCLPPRFSPPPPAAAAHHCCNSHGAATAGCSQHGQRQPAARLACGGTLVGSSRAGQHRRCRRQPEVLGQMAGRRCCLSRHIRLRQSVRVEACPGQGGVCRLAARRPTESQLVRVGEGRRLGGGVTVVDAGAGGQAAQVPDQPLATAVGPQPQAAAVPAGLSGRREVGCELGSEGCCTEPQLPDGPSCR